MNDNLLRFDWHYQKLNVCDGEATLLHVQEVRLRELSKAFLDYDTEGLYSFPKDKERYVLLILQGERGIFTTVRYTHPEKTRHFQRMIGQKVRIQVKQPKQKEDDKVKVGELCTHCGGDKTLANPSNYCDHTEKYPENFKFNEGLAIPEDLPQ